MILGRIVITLGVVSHTGPSLLADVANQTTLTDELPQMLTRLRKSRARHDPS